MDDELIAEVAVTKTGEEEKVVQIHRVPFVMGRVDSDLNLDDKAISRMHCSIARAGDAWMLRDLNSSNGTYVNNEKITEKILQTGDLIKIGQTKVRFILRPVGAVENLADNTALWNIVELSVGSSEEKVWLQSYLDTLIRRFRSDRGAIMTYDSATGVAMPVAVSGIELSDGELGKGGLYQSIVDRAIRGGRLVVTTSADEAGQGREESGGDASEAMAVVCAPARWQGQSVGAVYLERGMTKQEYRREEAQQLQDLADLLGTARMAWRGHLITNREEWEREQLGRTFADSAVSSLLAQGGASAVKRQIREVCIVAIHLGKLEEVFATGNEEIWRMISQFYGQVHEIFHRHGGALVAGGCAQFGSLEEKGTDIYSEAVRSGVEIQRAARALNKRLTQESKVGMSIGLGVATGDALIGFFGAGWRMDYLGFGEVVPAAYGIAFQAEDGEILVEQTTFNHVRLIFNTHRLAPISLPGVTKQVQLHRIVQY